MNETTSMNFIYPNL